MTTTTVLEHDHDHDYSGLLSAVEQNFAHQIVGAGALFTTDASGLFEAYLDNLPGERQVHTCNACRRFIETYGGLVTINSEGRTAPLMWGEAVPGFYGVAFGAMSAIVLRSRVTGVFLSKERTWGQPVTGPWRHMAVTPPPALVYKEGLLTAGQAVAAMKERHRTVVTALGEFSPAVLDETLRVLKADAVARAEKFIAPVQWLRDLHDRQKGRDGTNQLWLAIATAPEGYCHPRAAVTGSLMEDIAAGLPFADIERKFAAKMHPLQYQRPQAPPTAGNIKAAEAAFEKLGLAASLQRRFARLDELPKMWEPKVAEAPAGDGVFGHLKPKGETLQQVTLPAQTMTWEKFARTVLPTAEAIDLLVPHSGNFSAMLTAVDPEAPPILKWDREDARNPVSQYIYVHGSDARQWGLIGGSYATVTAVVDSPCNLGGLKLDYLETGILLTVTGAVDSRTGAGNAIFPENVREDLHPYRSTLEAYSKGAQIFGREEASACGLRIGKKSGNVRLRVKTGGAWADFHIDRWD